MGWAVQHSGHNVNDVGKSTNLVIDARLQGIMLLKFARLRYNAQHFDQLCLQNILLFHKHIYIMHWWIYWILNTCCNVASQKTQCSPEESESAVHLRSSFKQRILCSSRWRLQKKDLLCCFWPLGESASIELPPLKWWKLNAQLQYVTFIYSASSQGRHVSSIIRAGWTEQFTGGNF